MRIPNMRWVLALSIVCLGPQGFSQTLLTGELTGVVTDPSGAFVANATVNIAGATGKTFATTTGSGGLFRVPLLPPGPYQFTVSAPGFAVHQESTTVAIGFSSAMRIQLALETNREVVMITTETPLLQGNDANLVNLINTRFLQNVPNPGNDLTNFAFTTPGVTINTANGFGTFSSFGVSALSNLFTVNGSDLVASGASNLYLGANEIEEVAVVLNGYTGQYGRAAGANVNYITKSGSNSIHGNAAWMYNGRAFNANSWFNNLNSQRRPFAISNAWAYSLGGPLRKDKLFYFFDHEGMRYSRPLSSSLVIPTTDFANYVLAKVAATSPASVPLYDAAFKLYAGTPGADRATPVSTGPLGCGDFTESGFGSARPCARTLQAAANVPTDEWKVAGRTDYIVGGHDTLFVRFQAGGGRQTSAVDFINPVFSTSSDQPNYTGQVGYTHVWSPLSVNSLLISGTYLSALFAPDIASATRVFPTMLAWNKTFTNTGFPNGTPSGRKMYQWQLVDDQSWIRGAHTFRAGVNLRANKNEIYDATKDSFGTLTFNAISAFANASLGTGGTYSQVFSASGPQSPTYSAFGFYAEDAWRVTPALTLTLALRLDHNGNPHCSNGCFAEFTGSKSFSDIAHSESIPYNQSIQTGLKNLYAKVDAISAQPRVGLAYRFGTNTILRAGFGIFAAALPALLDRGLVNAPYVLNFTTNNGVVAPKGTPNSVFDILANSATAFQNGFDAGATLAAIRAQLPLFALPSMYSFATHFRTPRYDEWNIELQHEIAQRIQFSVNYVGNRSTHVSMHDMFGNAFSASGMGALPTSAPDPRFGNVFETVSRNRSNYNGLVTSAKWRFGRQFTGQVAYTWSHALDLCSNDCLSMPFNSFSSQAFRFQATPPGVPSLAYSHADYDTRHTWAANYVYTPILTGNRALRMIFNDWTLAGIVYSHTGYPFSPLNNTIINQTGNLTRPPQQQILAEYRGSAPYAACTQPNVPCLLASQFGGASQRSFGNIPRNSFRGPGFFNTDVNLYRTISIRERYRVMVGASFFNVLNHPNFDMPVAAVNNALFGRITQTVSQPTSPYGNNAGSAVSGRVVQTSIRFAF